MTQLPTPRLIRCYFEDGLQPRCRSWRCGRTKHLESAEQVWNLPEASPMTGPPPENRGDGGGATMPTRYGSYGTVLAW